MTEPRGPSGAGGLWSVVGAGALMVLCCAGPVLLAGGALSGLGAALRNPWLLGIGAAVILAAVVWTTSRVARRRRPGEADPCCPPPARSDPRSSAQVEKENGTPR